MTDDVETDAKSVLHPPAGPPRAPVAIRRLGALMRGREDLTGVIHFDPRYAPGQFWNEPPADGIYGHYILDEEGVAMTEVAAECAECVARVAAAAWSPKVRDSMYDAGDLPF
ncbi:MAG: hypothetical protein QOF49_859 [Chloroflexota bacterium]|jgi:hypothetical protein|nr:hypothetical protein [Chloroflexota bacterium]